MFRTIRKKKNEITIDMCDGLLAETDRKVALDLLDTLKAHAHSSEE